MMATFLHACNPDLAVATNSVNKLMRIVYEQSGAIEHNIGPAILAHWKYCLLRIYDDDPVPPDHYAEVDRLAEGHPIQPRFTLICPDRWQPGEAKAAVTADGRWFGPG